MKKGNHARVKVSENFYMSVCLIVFIPLLSIHKANDGVDKFFNYLYYDAMWDYV